MERKPRKLLVASVGVATIVYAACSTRPNNIETSGNLVAPDTGEPHKDAGAETTDASDVSVVDTREDIRNDG